MQDLIRPDASFTPRELFARMQGAWFEPRQGSMWQENTGVTPTTTGGQTIGRIADLSGYGNVATQANAANRPVLGRRYNLLTYSEDFSNGVWSITSGVTFSGNTAIFTANSYRYQSISVGSVFGKTYTIRAKLSTPTGKATIVLRMTNSVDGTDSVRQTISLTTTPTVYVLTRSFTSNGPNIEVGLDNRISQGGDNASGDVVVTEWDLRLTSDVGKDPTYQRITTATNYDYGQYPAAAHDTNDSLVVSLPNLGGGIFSASGSVYFATPQGMSALHNQSIGTSYNLPALQTDNYCTVITPARLPPPLEQRLALYMHRLAGLSDADFFWQEQATDGMTGQLLADDNDTILLRA